MLAPYKARQCRPIMHTSIATAPSSRPRLGFYYSLGHPLQSRAAFVMGGTVKQLVLGLLGAASGGHGGKKERKHQLQRVELRVRMDCERCERQVRKALAGMRGVEHVEVNRRQQRVTVTGSVDPHKVLRRARSTGKRAEPWPQQNPCYNGATAVMAHYGAIGAGAQAHDRWAPPPIYPRHPDAFGIVSGAGAERITDLFSDDNPNACSVM